MEECRAIARRCAAALEVAVLSELPVTLSEDSFATGDLSLELGKDPFKVPRFSRFAKAPKNIQASVMRMRALTQRRQAFRTRSWEAAFSFTRRSLKVPKFERFANPPGDITAAVQEMRLGAAAKRANRQRSWAASFKFARSSKKPQFERFGSPPSDIFAAVQEMRLAAAAKRANKRKFWAAAYFSFSRSSKKPQFKRFASPASDIVAAVQEMRLVAAAKRAERQRSWAAAFKFATNSKKPQFGRFARPPGDITAVVQEMRLVAAANKAKKQRSWAASFKFAGKSKQPLFRRFAKPASDITAAVWDMRQRLSAERAAAKAKKWRTEDQVLIEDVLDEPEVSTINSTSRDLEMKMLTAPPSEMEQIRERLQNLLMKFAHAVTDKHSVDMFLQQTEFPSPLGAALSFCPAEPLIQASIDSDLKAHSSWEQQYQPVAKPPAGNEVRAACEHCAKLLRHFRKQVETYKEEQQAEELIQQEQQRYSTLEAQTHRNVEQLIAEELAIESNAKLTGKAPPKGAGLVKGCMSYQSAPSLPGNTTKWFAGSSLAAVRQLRRSRVDSNTNHRDKPNKSSGFSLDFHDLDTAGEHFAYSGPECVGCAGAKSAMEMDLGI